MTPVQHSLASFIAGLRECCAPSVQAPIELQANAAFWVAVEAGVASDPSVFWVKQVVPVVETMRLAEAPYLAAVGYLVGAGIVKVTSEIAGAFARVAKRSPHTFERTGIADDPLCLVGLFLLSRAIETAAATRALLLQLLTELASDERQSASTMLLLVLADRSLVGTMRPWGQVTQPEVYSAVIAHRISGNVGTRMFPVFDRVRAEEQLLRDVCVGRVTCVAEDWNAMLLLITLELIIANLGYHDNIGRASAFAPRADGRRGLEAIATSATTDRLLYPPMFAGGPIGAGAINVMTPGADGAKPRSVNPSPAIFQDLRNDFASGNLIAFVGAGVATAAGLPDWASLAKQLRDRLQLEGRPGTVLDEIDDLIRRKQFIDALSAAKLSLGEHEFDLVVEKAVDDGNIAVPDVANALAELAPTLRAVVTTNLDRLLERAFGGNWQDLAEPTGDLAQRRHYILKLHGTRIDRRTWVFTRQQYDRETFGRPHCRAVFEALFRAYPMLFVGYGLADDDFDQTLAATRALAGPQPPHHFGLQLAPVPPFRRKKLEDAGVRLLEYGSHSDVPALLRSIR